MTTIVTINQTPSNHWEWRVEGSDRPLAGRARSIQDAASAAAGKLAEIRASAKTQQQGNPAAPAKKPAWPILKPGTLCKAESSLFGGRALPVVNDPGPAFDGARKIIVSDPRYEGEKHRLRRDRVSIPAGEKLSAA